MLLLTFALTESKAHAVPEAIRPGTKPFFAGLQMGGAISVADSVSQFKLREEFGWHFQGRFAGPAIGASLSEAFGSHFVTFTVAPKFWWDIPIADLGLTIAPFIHAGLGVLAPSGGNTQAGFNWQIGCDVRLVLFDTGYVSFQPFAFDFYHNSNGTSVRYDLLFGGGFTF